MLSHLDPASSLAIGLLIFALGMVIMFEAISIAAGMYSLLASPSLCQPAM